jgi:hypothetical protein
MGYAVRRHFKYSDSSGFARCLNIQYTCTIARVTNLLKNVQSRTKESFLIPIERIALLLCPGSGKRGIDMYRSCYYT